jgi:subtilisin family serine protease
MSTYLNGTYREMSGTSMSTPLVAGALSRLLQCRTYSSQESAMGVIIQNRDTVKSYNNLDVKASMEFDEMNVSPVLVVTNYQIVDTINGGNGDGKPNPGETIEIYPTVRCIYGNAYGVSVQMHHGLNVDTTTLDIIQRKAELYNLSPGSSVRSKTPIVAKVAERCEDGYTIQLYSSIHFDSVPGTSMAEISAYARKLVLKIEETSYLSGVLDTVLTLGPDKKHVINGNFALSKNGVLNILPGTSIVLNADCNFVQGKVNIKGKPDEMILFT